MAAAPLISLRRRSEFLRVRGGRRWHTPGFVIEMRPAVDEHGADPTRQDAAGVHQRAPIQPLPPRFGLTVTRKLGSAVVRNRIRRRLKAVLRSVALEHARPGCDYVLVARPEALTRDFAALRDDLVVAFARLHAQKKAQQPYRATAIEKSS